MTKKAIFATIKEANQIVDRMADLSTDSYEYSVLNEALGWTLDSLVGCKNCSLHMSKRTGHYFVRFA